MNVSNLGGVQTDYDIELRKTDGTLIYREASVMFPPSPPPPKIPECPDCIEDYIKDLEIFYEQSRQTADLVKALREYHHLRCEYCKKHRDDIIEEKYRTGEPSPKDIQETLKEIKILKKLIGG